MSNRDLSDELKEHLASGYMVGPLEMPDAVLQDHLPLQQTYQDLIF
ncbi:hypothetical protein JNUCC31_17310 [Paenibacillus sp. JNUCC31]|nr:hypothetical protein [Paenibacillus sp. JNUCC-31]QOS76613.1 hypothetical protein JNUCC31_17310 [Paenibacillus sp. JNUCC-31]